MLLRLYLFLTFVFLINLIPGNLSLKIFSSKNARKLRIPFLDSKFNHNIPYPRQSILFFTCILTIAHPVNAFESLSTLFLNNFDLFNPAVFAAELAIAPAVFLYYQQTVNSDFSELRQKYEKLEQAYNLSRNATTEFSEDMKGALVAYKNLYGALDIKLDSLLEQQNLTNMITESILKTPNVDNVRIAELQNNISYISETLSKINKTLDTSISSVKSEISNNQKSLTSQLNAAQTLNMRERAAIRRDMKSEQEQALNLLNSRLASLQNNVQKLDSFSKSISNDLASNKANNNKKGKVEPTTTSTSEKSSSASATTIQPTIENIPISSLTVDDILSSELASYPTTSTTTSSTVNTNYDNSNNKVEKIIDTELRNEIETNNTLLLKSINTITNKINTLQTSLQTLTSTQKINNNNNNNNNTLLKTSLQNLEQEITVIKDSITSTISEVKDLQQKLQTQFEEVNKEQLQLTNSIQNEIITQNSKYQILESNTKEIESLKSKLQNIQNLTYTLPTSDRVSDIELQLQQAQQSSNLQLNSIQSTLLNNEREINSLKNTLVSNTSALLNQFLHLENKTIVNLAELTSSLYHTNVDLDDSIEKLGQQQYDIADEFRRSLDTINTTSLQQYESIQRNIERLNNTIQSNDIINKNDISSLKENILQNLETITDSTSNDISTLKSEFQNDLKQLRKGITNEILSTQSQVVDTLTTSINEEINNVNKKLDSKINSMVESSEKQTNQLVSNINDIRESIGNVESTLRTEVQSNTSRVEKKVSGVEDVVRRLATSSASNLDNVKGTIDLRLNTLQKEVKESTSTLQTHISELDESVESRVEEVLESRSITSRIGRMLGATGRAIGRGVKKISGKKEKNTDSESNHSEGGKNNVEASNQLSNSLEGSIEKKSKWKGAKRIIKNVSSGTVGYIKSSARGVSAAAKNTLSKLSSKLKNAKYDDDEDQDDVTIGNSSNSNARYNRSSSQDDISDEITITDELPSALQ